MMNDFGQILHVNLKNKTCSRGPLPANSLATFIGGRGFNVWYLYHHLPSSIDALSEENLLLLSCGLLTGSSAPSASRLHINALSPLTGILGSSNVGGYVGAWLRSCGLQSVVIEKSATAPIYLYISETQAELRDARFLWGLDAFATQERLKSELNDRRLKILTIGPAGENGVRYACIMTEKDHAAGRTGMGAVMGAKNLKAIVIAKGSRKALPSGASTTNAAAREAVKQYVLKLKKSEDFRIFSQYGGAGYVTWANDMGIMGTKNYRHTGFTPIDQADGKRLKKNRVRSSGCFRCPVQCKADLRFNRGKPDEWLATRPEFEPIINLGAKCGLSDLKQIVRLDNLCSRLGLDSTSTASSIAFAMDLFETGILTKGDVNELELAWGNGAAMETLIHRIAAREGLGDILAQGVRRAADMIGKGADQYAAHAKGLELTAYHPGAILGTALGYAVSSRGGDYNNVYACIEYGWSREKSKREFGSPDAVNIKKPGAKGHLVKRSVLVNIIIDCLGLCKVPVLSMLGTFDLKFEAQLTATLIGQPLKAEDLFKTGERIAAYERLFNLRHSPNDLNDDLPDMFFKDRQHPLTRKKLAEMTTEFYEAMGWDVTGRPKKENLKGLGID